MVGKAAFLLGLGTGYVLGAQAGHDRYEQIKAQARRFWNDPTVQQKATQAQELAKQTAPQIPGMVADAARKAVDTVTRDGSDPDESTGAVTATGSSATTDGRQ